MRRFLASAWFPFLMCLVLAGATAAAFAGLHPVLVDTVNGGTIPKNVMLAAWALGPAAGLLSFLLASIVNLFRRLVRLRRVQFLHPIVVLASIGPWLVLSWILTDEPRFTPFARVLIDFAARELLWGSLIACLLTVLLSIPLLIPAQK